MPLFSPYTGPEPSDIEIILASVNVAFYNVVVEPLVMTPITPPH